MASASIARRKLPADALIFRTYTAELAHGSRGAYARSARALGVSDQHVVNVVKRHTQQAPILQDIRKNAPELMPDTLTYVPAPGERELENERLLCRLLLPTPPLAPVVITPIVERAPLPTLALLATPERRYVGTPCDYQRQRARELEQSTRLVAGLLVAITAAVVLVGSKAPGLAVVLLGPVLVLWRELATAQRARRHWRM